MTLVTNEKLIGEAAQAMSIYEREQDRLRGDESQRIFGHRGAFIAEHFATQEGRARAALAVFEKAHTPTDDEREALAYVIEQGWGNPTWDGKTLRPIDRQIADAVLAAGFRRSEKPEPSTDTGCPHEATEIDSAGQPTRCADCGVDLTVVPASSATLPLDDSEACAGCGSYACDCYASSEPQGEPSDALDLDRLESLAKAATPGPWDFIFGGPTQEEDGSWYEPTESGVRSDIWENDFPHADAEFIAATDPHTVLALIAALRAASAVTEQGEN